MTYWPHILETALLFLAAFLLGAGLATLIRRLTLQRKKPAAVSVVRRSPELLAMIEQVAKL